MCGQPVWLASLSRPNPHRNARLPTNRWTAEQRAAGIETLRRLLGPAGNAARERVFRMQITLCIHRALTSDEVDRLPSYFGTDPAIDIAGGPVEVLEETEPGLPSTQPCHNMGRYPIDRFDRDLWLPIDCGECPPCRARRAAGDEDLPVIDAGRQWQEMTRGLRVETR